MLRPPTEPVPTVLLGSPAADIFRHLIRMNDGPGHCLLVVDYRPSVNARIPLWAKAGGYERYGTE